MIYLWNIFKELIIKNKNEVIQNIQRYTKMTKTYLLSYK